MDFIGQLKAREAAERALAEREAGERVAVQNLEEEEASKTETAEKPIVLPRAWQDIVTNDNEAIIIDLYAKGLSTREISNHMRSQRSVEVSPSSVSSITDKVFPLIKEWQSRVLPTTYAIIFLDGLRFNVREAGRVAARVAYVAMGVTITGQKELLGFWVSDSESSKFWMGVLNEIKNRGTEDALIVCVDGLKGFPEAIKNIYPLAQIQVCIIHQIRHTMMFVPTKHRKEFCEDLREIYAAPTEESGIEALNEVIRKWPQYRPYLKSWEDRWQELNTFFEYPSAIRKLIYSTNAIENLNRQFRRVTKTTIVFPHDEAVLKLLWLAQVAITEKWIHPIHNWGEIMAALSIMFPDRIRI